MRWWSLVPLLLLHRAVGLRAQTPDRWRAAAAAIRRLPPDSFPRLPARIRYALAARGCTIPQSFTEKRPHNVVTGRFARAGQHDWAVLCSRQDSSSVLIFWGGRQPAAPAELGRAADASFLEDIGGGRIRYFAVDLAGRHGPGSRVRRGIRRGRESTPGSRRRGGCVRGRRRPSSTWRRAAGFCSADPIRCVWQGPSRVTLSAAKGPCVGCDRRRRRTWRGERDRSNGTAGASRTPGQRIHHVKRERAA